MEILNRKGKKIAADVHYPKQKYTSVVILVHGFMGSKDHSFMKHLAQGLCEAGFISIRFDFTNEIGESEGDIEEISFENEIEDLKDVINYARTLDGSNGQIALIGHSLGGAVSLVTAKREDIMCTVSMSSPVETRKESLMAFGVSKEELDNWERKGYIKIKSPYMDREVRLPWKFFEERSSYDFGEILENTKNHLVIQGNADKVVPLEAGKRIYKKVKEPKRIVIIDELTHFYKDENALNKVLDKTKEWLNEFI